MQRAVAEKETEALRVELADAVRLRMLEKDLRQRADTALVAAKQEITTSSAEIQELKFQLEAERDAVAQAAEAQQHYAATKAELKQSKAEMEWQQALAKTFGRRNSNATIGLDHRAARPEMRITRCQC